MTVTRPLEVVRHIVEHLKPGGTFHLNFVHAPGGANLAEAAAQRAEAIKHLEATLQAEVPLHVDVPEELYARYVKPRG